MSGIDPFLRSDAPEPDTDEFWPGHGYEHRENPVTAVETWEPGERLYDWGRGNYVRSLFQLIPDHHSVSSFAYWCHACDVCWDSEGKPICWYCGASVLHPYHPDESEYRKAYRAEAFG